MRRKTALVLCLLSLVFSHAGAAELDLEGDIRFLAQDPLEGRLTGTEGARRAAEFLASRLEKLGAKALPSRDTFLVPFEFTSGVRDSGSSLTLLSSDGSVDREWSAGEHAYWLWS